MIREMIVLYGGVIALLVAGSQPDWANVPPPTNAKVELKLEAPATAVYGETIDVDIVGRSTSDGRPATLTYAGVLIKYDPDILQPIDITRCDSPLAWHLSYLCTGTGPDDYPCFCVNGKGPWPKNDGLIYVSHVADRSYSMYLGTDWKVFSTIKFAVGKNAITAVSIQAKDERCGVRTEVSRYVVYDLTAPIDESAVQITILPCPDVWEGSADIDRDGIVGATDQLIMLQQWGTDGQ